MLQTDSTGVEQLHRTIRLILTFATLFFHLLHRRSLHSKSYRAYFESSLPFTFHIRSVTFVLIFLSCVECLPDWTFSNLNGNGTDGDVMDLSTFFQTSIYDTIVAVIRVLCWTGAVIVEKWTLVPFRVPILVLCMAGILLMLTAPDWSWCYWIALPCAMCVFDLIRIHNLKSQTSQRKAAMKQVQDKQLLPFVTFFLTLSLVLLLIQIIIVAICFPNAFPFSSTLYTIQLLMIIIQMGSPTLLALYLKQRAIVNAADRLVALEHVDNDSEVIASSTSNSSLRQQVQARWRAAQAYWHQHQQKLSKPGRSKKGVTKLGITGLTRPPPVMVNVRGNDASDLAPPSDNPNDSEEMETVTTSQSTRVIGGRLVQWRSHLSTIAEAKSTASLFFGKANRSGILPTMPNPTTETNGGQSLRSHPHDRIITT